MSDTEIKVCPYLERFKHSFSCKLNENIDVELGICLDGSAKCNQLNYNKKVLLKEIYKIQSESSQFIFPQETLLDLLERIKGFLENLEEEQ